MDVNAPPYSASSSLPIYTPDAQSNERTISAAVRCNPLNTVGDSVQEYQYMNGRLKLNLGPKTTGLFRPAYGWNDTVDGYVELKQNTKNVQSIVASVEGYITAGLSERGFLKDQTKTTVLRMSRVLFDSSTGEGQSVGGSRYAFSFPLPSYTMGGTLPLPPTFAALHAGLGVDVTYYVKIEMVRKGMLRPNVRIKAFFYYLPRTYAPLSRCEMLAHEDVKPMMGNDSGEWRVFEVLPRLPSGASSMTAASLNVSLALPRPLIYAALSSIPFSLTIESGAATGALPLLFSCITVQLIRVTTLMVCRWRTVYEHVLGGGEVFRIEERENARTMFGSVTCSKLGEASWRAEGIEVKYIVRIQLSPRGDIPSLASALPTYVREEVVTLKTHQQTRELDGGEATLPALCRAPRVTNVF